MWALAGWCALHVAAVQLVGSPWWVPNFTLIGLVRGVVAAPSRWLWIAAVCGALLSLWVVRWPGALLLGCVAGGGLLRAAAAQWNLQDRRVELATAAILSAGWVVSLLIMDHLWSLPIAGLAAWHVAATCAGLAASRRLRGPG